MCAVVSDGDEMKIENLVIKDFRCYESLDVDFDAKLNVLVGVNGAGKTTVLDAISACYDSMLAELVGGIELERMVRFALAQNLKVSDIRRLCNEGYSQRAVLHAKLSDGGTVNRIKDYDEAEDSEREEHGPPDAISRRRTNRPRSELNDELRNKLRKLRKAIIESPSELNDLPIIAYYRSTRKVSQREETRTTKDRVASRFDALKHSNDAFANFENVVSFLAERDAAEAREIRVKQDLSHRDPLKRWIEEAAVSMIEPLRAIGFSLYPPFQLVLDWGNGDASSSRLLDQLSDGYRNMLALVMDFSRRLTQANPHLGNPLEAKAVLMIDEIDLHLHPEWQQRVIPDLQRTFPNTQIICTTHSPQVLSTVKPENILMLYPDRVERATGEHSYGAESQNILNGILGVTPSPELPDVEKLKAQLMDGLAADAWQTEEWKETFDALEQLVGPYDTFLSNVRLQLAKLKKAHAAV